MDDLFIYEVEKINTFSLRDFIKIQCFVSDCESTVTDQFISIPTIINIDFLGDQKIILYMCKQHFAKRHYAYQENKFHLNITICQQDIIKELKPVKYIYDKELQLRISVNKLNKNACCMRENIKYENLQLIFTYLGLISNDDDRIIQAVKKMLFKKYFELCELNYEFKKSNQMNILKNLVLLHQIKQNTARITSFQRKSLEWIIESQYFLQPNQ